LHEIATFNINNVIKRLLDLLAWSKSSKSDIARLQELKADQGDFAEAALPSPGIRPPGPGNERGTACPSCRVAPKSSPRDEGCPAIPSATRAVTSRPWSTELWSHVCIRRTEIRARVRNSTTNSALLKRLSRHATTLRKTSAPIVLAGDFNVMPTL
jgi:exodeoxyribonuclease-3